jgi:hypothetical protein
MNLSRKNYKKVLPKELVKQAEKCKVRECDEARKGHFEAYVDEKETTFDVLIVILNEEVTEHRCDCKSTIAFCRHKTAVLLFLENEANGSSQKIIRNRKASAFETLLEEIDAERLKDWVRNLLIKNKELEIVFLHQFSRKQKDYNPHEVKQLTLNTVKAVAGNRKKLEPGEVKKIVDLWKEIHDPVTSAYFSHLANKESFLSFHAIAEICNEILLKTNGTTSRVHKYIEGLLLNAITPLHNIQDEDDWNTATGYFLEQLNNIQWGLRDQYLSFLSLLHEASSEERRIRLTHKLVSQYSKFNTGKQFHSDTYTYSTLVLVKKSGLFNNYFNIFKPVQFNKDYNNELISLLIQFGHLDLAEKYCIEQIEGNYSNDYSISYLEHLKKIYTHEKNYKKLSTVLKELIPKTFDFTDFITIYEQMEGDEKKQWRTKILKRAGHMSSYNQPAIAFQFRLMDYEKNYKKMIGYISTYTPYSIIVQYAGNMALANKNEFIRQLINMSNYGWPNMHEEEEDKDKIFLQLFNILRQHYTENELKAIIETFEKARPFYRVNKFVDFMKKNL